MIGVNSIGINEFTAKVESAFKLHDIPVNIRFFSNIDTFINKLDFRDFKCDMAFISSEACGVSDLEGQLKS